MTSTLTPTAVTRATSLVDALAAEDNAEDTGWLDTLDRMTCPDHRRWIHECLHSSVHAGFRRCRPCRRDLAVVTDEVTGTVTLHCPGCHRGPRTRTDAQLVSACTASMFAARRAA